jgi:DNA repair protein SbcD/Mre11
MRILHTADWHLKDKLGWIDRTDDLNKSLTEIAEILVNENVDVMIVAGDLFRERLTKEELKEAISDIARIFGSWLARGGTIIAIAGNHDNRTQFETLHGTLKLAPGASKGRIHLFASAETIILEDKNGQKIQFVCHPYPDEAFIRGVWATEGELNRTKQDTCQKVLNKLEKELDPKLKTVFIGHMHVFGVPVGPRDDHYLSSEDDVQITPSDLPMNWAYLAFGHIHKAQMIHDAPHARYCGSIQALDAGEKDDEKGVVLVDVEPTKQQAIQRWVPLKSVSRIKTITVVGEDGLIGLESDTEALVKATVRCVGGKDNFGKIKRRIRELYPRAYSIKEERVTSEGHISSPSRDLSNVNDNICEFLSQATLKSDRSEILRLVKELF